MKSREERIKEQEKLLGIFDEVKEVLMKTPGVINVAIGLKQKSGKLTDEIVFQVFVENKKDINSLSPEEIIPNEIRGVKTDVLKVPKGKARSDPKAHSPIQGGIQIGNGKGEIGTLGWFGRLASDNSLVLLTNEHVLYSNGANGGDKIGQPDLEDICCCCCAYTEGIIGEILNPGINTIEVDCAIAKISSNVVVDCILNNGMFEEELIVNNTAMAVIGSQVLKVGCTSGLTKGVISSIGAPASDKVNQILIYPTDDETYKINGVKLAFSDAGDSGSIIIDEHNNIVGLLWGGDSELHSEYDVTFAIPIDKVLEALANAGLEIILESTPAVRSKLQEQQPAREAGIDSDIKKKLLASSNGTLIITLFEMHQKEIIHLINHNRKVKITWQRVQGPSFVAHLLNSSNNPSYIIPNKVRDISRQDLIIKIAAVLREEGSELLQKHIEKHLIDLLQYSYELDSIEGFLKKVQENALA
ncbi:MAG: hypothetical protein J7604_06745 [Sporocytophaga sp.]|uniref:hypothetical protein n=1 Tax=Sporocytophaga sp. TaxID=2231183 RepID=UPI001B280D33|nr:hypothetical protein [Sporocytophaga sp.]MBO9699892.1 hypothetical protein [Sporocytophaga sp.]